MEQTQNKGRKKKESQKQKYFGRYQASGKATKPQKALSATPIELGHLVRSHLLRGGSYRDIPFILPRDMKRTQVVQIRLPTDYIAITTTASFAYTTVTALIFSLFGNNADLKNTFDEQRVVKGRCYYIPRYSSPVGGTLATAQILQTGGAVIEYANGTAFGSTASLLQHDNHVLFNLTPLNYLFSPKKREAVATAEWPILPDNMPDQQWQDSNAPANFAWWKPYFAPGDVGFTATTGYLVAECDFQFRGMK